MITEQYVSFETAKLLKEKGFDLGCHSCYVAFGDNAGKPQYLANTRLAETARGTNFNWDKGAWISRPTQSLVMRWLREVYGIHIQSWCSTPETYSENEGIRYSTVITNLNNDCAVFPTSIGDRKYNTYEEACEEAIKYCLENLI